MGASAVHLACARLLGPAAPSTTPPSAVTPPSPLSSPPPSQAGKSAMAPKKTPARPARKNQEHAFENPVCDGMAASLPGSEKARKPQRRDESPSAELSERSACIKDLDN